MDCEAPATRAELETIVADARRLAPLNVPADAISQLLGSGATPTEARARLYETVWGHCDLTADRPIASVLLGGRA